MDAQNEISCLNRPVSAVPSRDGSSEEELMSEYASYANSIQEDAVLLPQQLKGKLESRIENEEVDSLAPLPFKRSSVTSMGGSQGDDTWMREALDVFEKDSVTMLSHTSQTKMSLETDILSGIDSELMEDITVLSLTDQPSANDGAEKLVQKKQGKAHSPMRCVHEGLYSKVYHVNNQMHGFVETTGDVAVKILSEQFPNETQITRLENERRMSKRLSGKCVAIRGCLSNPPSTIGVEGSSSHALYLEWVPGVTLREWVRIKSDKMKESATLHESSLQMARMIALSLNEIHETGGVALNNISSENIIVNDISKSGNDYTVHMIGLGSASLLQKAQPKGDTNCEKDGIQKDLRSLGEVLFELFSGKKPHKNNSLENDYNILGEKTDSVVISIPNNSGDQPELYQPLRELRSILSNAHVPPQIAAFILELMGVFALSQTTISEYPYKSVCDVSNQLLQLISKPKSFQLDSSDPDFSKALGHVHFTANSLYGRKEQQAELMGVYERVILQGGEREVVVVSGFSGVGKTSFVEQTVRQPVGNKGGYFLHVKFDQHHQAKPLAAILTAFTDFCDSMYLPTTLNMLATVIEEMIGHDGLIILGDLIPTFGKIIGRKDTTQHISLGRLKSQNRLNSVIQAFVKAITGPTTPIIMFFDDMQWADKASLDLIRALVMDSETRSRPLLFIESYRINEVTRSNHPFPVHLSGLKVMVRFTEIQIINLMTDDLNDLVSNAIREPQSTTKPLSDIIYRKTGGNVLLAIEFVKSLWDKGLVWFSFYKKAWQWDASLIQAEKLVEDAAALIAQKILYLPSNSQLILKKMACFGSQCEKSTLSLIEGTWSDGAAADGDEKSTMDFDLEIAIKNGIIEKVGSKYKFAHDQIQLATYSLIPQSERSSWHLRIGKKMVNKCTTEQLEKRLFVIVDQLNRGEKSIAGKSDRIQLAELNCRAGEKAKSSGVFSSASLYLEKGISLLDKNPWNSHYLLWLRLYTLYAEVEFCSGDFKKMGVALENVLNHGKSFDDKLRAYCVLIFSLNAQNKQAEAIEMGLGVLEELGEKFQADSTGAPFVEAELLKTNEMLNEHTADTLMSKVMSDKRMITTMEILESIVLFSFYSTTLIVPFIICRMIQLSVNHGICASTVFALGAHSSIICSILGDVKRADKYGKLALDIMKRMSVRHDRSKMVIYGYVFPRIMHLHSCTGPVLECYNECVRVGDSLFAIASSAIFATLSFQGGKNLPAIEKFLIESEKEALEYKQETWQIVLPMKQTILNLMGKANNASLLEGDAISFKECFSKPKDKQGIQLTCRLYLYQMRVAYMFGNLELATQMVIQSHGTEDRFFGKYECCEHLFYDSLVCFAKARKTDEGNWRSLALECMIKMQKWAEGAPCNCEHKLHLLEAEQYFVLGKITTASERYESAIALSKKHRFIQDEALSYERAAMFYLEIGDNTKASQYYGNAHNAYIEWGAIGKAEHLRDSSPF